MTSSPENAPLTSRARQLLGWQGLTLQVPADWNPGKFGGNRDKGELRVDDENGVRLELRWEKSANANVERSVENFLKTIEKDAKKRKSEIAALENLHFVSKHKRGKEQIQNFGWRGDAQSPASCGFGVAWHCPTCERVVFAHLLGQKGENPKNVEKIAANVFPTLECHGEGGWETWSAFELRAEIPVEFVLFKAQFLVNKVELEWIRPKPTGIYGLGRRAERLKIARFPVANVLLDGKTLEEWSEWNLGSKNKQLALEKGEETEFNGHQAWRARGGVKDLRIRASIWFFDFILRRKTPKGEVLAWQCPQSNRLFSFESEVSVVNSHVPDGVLESLECH